jgi:hypothetical protein
MPNTVSLKYANRRHQLCQLEGTKTSVRLRFMGTAQQELELSTSIGVPNVKRNSGSPTAQDKLWAICVWLDNKIRSHLVCLVLAPSCSQYCKVYFVLFHERDIAMTNVEISASEQPKPDNPTAATPQQHQPQRIPPKPADKPAEPQK